MSETIHSHSEEHDPTQVAGVTSMHMSSEPWFTYKLEEYGGEMPYLERVRDRAQANFEADGFTLNHDSTNRDQRIPTLTLYDADNYSPAYSFMLTASLVERIREARDQKGEPLSQDEYRLLALKEGADAVNPGFTTDAMNAINASYYATDMAFDTSAGLATMFVKNRPINVALGGLMARNRISDSASLRIKELSSGSNTNHWNMVADGLAANGITEVDLTVTDFVEPQVHPELAVPWMNVRAETYSLFDDMPELSLEDRFDVLITTYGFDSAWQPEDIHVTRVNDQWYKEVYRIKVADWAPRRKELLQALRDSQPLPNARPEDYDGITLERATEPIDITDHPYGQYLMESGRNSTNFPGGLIKRVVNAFDAQLTEGGAFVIGDAGNFGGGTTYTAWNTRTSGVAARYRMDDYVLAKKILEAEHGLDVSLLSLSELVDTYDPEGLRATTSETEKAQVTDSATNGIMVVTRQKQRDNQV